MASAQYGAASMICAIMQPTYLPWAGYLNLIHRVDRFVFLDDAQYERSSWQNRNRILLNGSPHWLTVPVLRGHFGATLDAVRTDERLPWRRKHIASLHQAYGRHPFAADARNALALAEDCDGEILADLDIRIIRGICANMHIETPLLRSSAIGADGVRTQRLIAICDALGCDEYLSPPGSMGYLETDGFERITNIDLQINRYDPMPYKQKGIPKFVSHLSIIDVVANLGWAAAEEYVKMPRLPPEQQSEEANEY